MNVASVESVTLQDQGLKQLILQEIDRQLAMVPHEITQSINREYATSEVLKLLSPMVMQGNWKHHQAHQQFHPILNLIIADATSLSLIRLVCHIATTLPTVPSSRTGQTQSVS